MLVLTLLLAQNIVPTCDCDPAKPMTLEERKCGLTAEAEKQPPTVPVVFVKDINPRKPNRMLALPRASGPGRYSLDELSPPERTVLWTAAIQKARELWGNEWAVAYNGDKVRTQCQPHIHIGKLNAAARLTTFIEIGNPSQIPAPRGRGIWIYPHGNKLRVHVGEQITETALLR